MIGSRAAPSQWKGQRGPRACGSWFLAASPGGDQPGARIEHDAVLVAVVGREHRAQALDGACRLAIAQAREGRTRVLKPRDDRERGIEVVAVEHGLVDLVEADVVKAG